MNRVVHTLLVFAALLVQASSAAGQADPPSGLANSIAQARESAWKTITSGHGSGVTVAMMERGELVYSEAMGVADRARNRAVDRNTRFNVGSVAKMFAAVAILLLVDEGRVELDAPVVRYIPEFTMPDPRFRRITVRMLLTHSSGLPGSSFFFGFEPDATTHAVLLETLGRSTLKHDPGAMSMYCNDGFTLAEIVVERVSGSRYMDFLAARVFAPLGMTRTGASVGESGGDNVAEYYEAKSGKKYPREVVPVYATGGIASTAEDLCRFGNALLPGGKALLSPASLQEIMRPQPTPFAVELRNSQQFSQFGWDYSTLVAGSVRVLAKGGNSGFYSANLQILPEERIVIAMTTSGPSGADDLTKPILAGLLQDRHVAVPAGVKRPPRAQPIPAALGRYEGYYAMESGALKVSIDKSRRKLQLTPMARHVPPVALDYEDGYFYGPNDSIRYYFATVQGKDVMVANTTGLIAYDAAVFQKLEPVRRPPALKAPMHDVPWLIRNVPASVEAFEGTRPMLTSHTYKELPGYVDFDGVRRIERGDFAGIAATALRDQSDLALVSVDGKLWMRTANVLRSPAREAPKLDAGPAAVTIGPAGYNEWRAVDRGAALRFVPPDARGRVIVAAGDKVVHDNLVDGNEVFVPAGSYVFFAGVPGQAFGVVEIPVAARTR